MFSKVKELFKKEETFECIVWDGKMMRYMDLTQKQIDEINQSEKYKEWSVTKKKEC